jgi:Cu/Ag efflux protein CusF
MSKLKAFFLVAVCCSPLFYSTISRADSPKAKGNVKSVDLVAGTFSVKIKRNNLTFQTDETTAFVRNGEKASLTDLADGDRATVSYDAGSMVATRVEARGDVRPNLARVEGTISGVDLVANTVTILPARDGATAVTLNVTADTSITLDGRPARPGDLQRGFAAGAAYDTTTLNAARISAESYADARGVISEVDTGQHKLAMLTASGEPLVLNVTPGTRISLNDRPATLEDLHRGFKVLAVYIEATLSAVRIAAESRGEVTGHIRSVDTSTATVVILPLVDGLAVELHVTRSTVIRIGDRPATLDQLRAGMAARALFDIVSFNAFSIDARPLPGGDDCTLVRTAGAVARVNPDEQTLTIDPAVSHEFITLNVLERTEITLDGRPARLTELRAGMRVEAAFCRENQNATVIAARSGETDCTPARISGAIVRIDPDAGAVAIASERDSAPVVLSVTERTEITLNGRPARLSELRVGMRADAAFCRESLVARSVAAGTPDSPR